MPDAIQEDVSTPLNINSAAEKILAMDEPPQEELPNEESQEVETEIVEAESEEAEEVAEEPEDENASLSELVEYLAENKEVYDDIVIPTKVNGKEGKATLSELVRAYQINQSVDQKADSLANEKKQFESQKTEQLSHLDQQLEQAKGLVQGLEQQFLKEFQAIDWDDLRSSDPAEFSARRQELLERHQGLQMAKNHIVTQQRSQFTENYQKHIQEQMEKLPELIPEWGDETVAKAEKKELRDYLLSSGIPQAQVDGQVDEQGNVISPGLSDAAAIQIARKAMLYDRGIQKVDVTKKKVKTLPKVLKAGKTTTREEISTQAYKKKRGKLKKSGRVHDAASLIYDRLNGG